MKETRKNFFKTPALLTCAIAYLIALILALIDVRLSAIPLSLFLLLCLAAPFFPGFSFYLPIISKGHSARRAVALTFDDGPDPLTTPALLELLKKYDAPATFFVTGKRAAEHRSLVYQILAGGHIIGNHSYNHFPLLMLRSTARLREEVLGTQRLLHEFGISPRIFRPPVGITSPRLGPVLAEAGLVCVNYSRRACDAGNRRIRRLSEKILKSVKSGDIILLHDSTPNRFDIMAFLREVEAILAGLRTKGLRILPLSDIIGKEIT